METSSRNPEIDRLERLIAKLRIEYERFFSGDLDAPPEELRDQVRRRIAGLRSRRKQSLADTFRLNNLEARFQSYSELFQRRLRNREGRPAARRVRPGPDLDPAKGVVFGEDFDPGLVKPLYDRLYRSGGRDAVDPDAFTTYLERQHALIRRRSGCARVRFRVVDEGGKPKLKARAEKETP